jgi:DNA-binding MarR family transcriptional regulator
LAKPGWEVLLALFKAEAAFQRTTVSNLCDASHTTSSTAMRWIDQLVEVGYVSPDKSRTDARVVFVKLNPKARAAIHVYFREIWMSLYDAD